ncbi:MAG TPA: HipA N-terminal domain-containing protein [Limnobacter sp.]|nr:HipA N-terminal domain-containing protein [Limnobacter sp.]
MQWYFDNLLPEEGARVLLAKDARVDRADAFGLLQHYGAESAGSMTLLPPGLLAEQSARLKGLSQKALQSRIEQLPRVPLSHGASKKCPWLARSTSLQWCLRVASCLSRLAPHPLPTSSSPTMWMGIIRIL